MTAERLRSYRFSTGAQWNACRFAQADRDSARAATGEVRPFAPYSRPGTRHTTPGAHAPAVTRTGDILWHDARGFLHRLSPCDDAPVASPAPFSPGIMGRVVATPSGLWVRSDATESLQRFEEDPLTRVLTVTVPHAHVVDVAGASNDSLWTLVERDRVWQADRIDRAGHIIETVSFKDIAGATAFVYLRRARRFVVLAGGSHPRLYWFAADGGPAVFSIAIAALRPCFRASVLGSDSRDQVFVAGADDDGVGAAYVLILDGDGNPLGEVQLDPLDAPTTGVTADRASLLVTGPRGLVRFSAAEVVPDGAGQVACMLITPMLESPDRQDGRRWLRVEASASLPEGATLELTVAATDDPATRDRVNALAADESVPASHRIQRLLSESQLWRGRTEFHGSDARPERASAPFSAKLFDVRERYLWVFVRLSAAPGARLPVLSQLAVLYPGRTLMESLPAVYQRAEAEPQAFVRDLVGVLEATTQGLDASIAAMGSKVHPSTAPEPWLNFIARWLGVPWDDGLTLPQKRAIMTRSAELARARGTRAGLEALLDSLMPGPPRRFRVTDATADFGFATVGGEACSGSPLPAILGGLTRWSAELDSRAVLGYTRLPCAGQRDDGAWQLSGRVRIEVAARAEERKAWEPWLLALLREMVPLTARVELRWVTAQTLQTNLLDGMLQLEAPPAPHLGTDAVTGLARLPERGIRLSVSGPEISTPLR